MCPKESKSTTAPGVSRRGLMRADCGRLLAAGTPAIIKPRATAKPIPRTGISIGSGRSPGSKKPFNVATPVCIGSLEFGTHVLGAKVLYVLGHTNCGEAGAAVKGETVPGQISSLFQHLRPAVKSSKGDINAAIRENVRTQATLLSEASPVIAWLIKDLKLTVAGGVYDITTGKVIPVEL